METWLILLGVLLPIASLLQFSSADERTPRSVPVPVESRGDRRA